MRCMWRAKRPALWAMTVAVLVGAASAGQCAPASSFVTLGTMGGPIPSPTRAQPANLLQSGDQSILIDAGDGAAEQLAKAGIPLRDIRIVFISHLHFDHTGGLFALIGMRYQVVSPGLLTIYGPPGTRRLVDGLVAAMQPASETGAGIPGQVRRPPEATVRAVEIGDGDSLALGNVTVHAVANSHYSYPAGSIEARERQSLSFRFDLPDRAIVYTGDTGPSAAVERLAQGADLLVGEVIDPPAAIDTLRRASPTLPAPAIAAIAAHFTEQHLTPHEIGLMAQRAGVKAVVLTHNALGSQSAEETRSLIAANFHGPVAIASDLDRF
jgi:ribonuclease BN (tRNA processing enzyme)